MSKEPFILNTQHSIANSFIAELRSIDLQQDRMRFRRNLERIGEVLAYEISKTLSYQEQEVETQLGIARENVYQDNVVIGSILRAGIPFHQGVLNYFDRADNAFVSAYRRHHRDGTFEIKLEYLSSPDLTDTVLILADPMLATGASMHTALEALLEKGKPQAIHIVTAVASTQGLAYMQRLYGNAHFWIGALDDELTAKSYIVPGLGDAGDLAFGAKL